MPGLQALPNLAVRPETSDAGSMTGAGIDNDEGSLEIVDNRPLRWFYPDNTIVDGLRKSSSVQNQLVLDLKNVGDRFRHVFQVLLSPLAHHVPVQYGSLARVDEVFRQRTDSSRRIDPFSFAHLNFLCNLNGGLSTSRHDVDAAVGIERLAGETPRKRSCQEGAGEADVHSDQRLPVLENRTLHFYIQFVPPCVDSGTSDQSRFMAHRRLRKESGAPHVLKRLLHGESAAGRHGQHRQVLGRHLRLKLGHAFYSIDEDEVPHDEAGDALALIVLFHGESHLGAELSHGAWSPGAPR